MYARTVIDFHLHIGRKEDWHPWVIEYLKETTLEKILYKNAKKVLGISKK